MDIAGLAAFGANIANQNASLNAVKQAVQTNSQVAKMMSAQATEQAKAAAAHATTTHKLDILA